MICKRGDEFRIKIGWCFDEGIWEHKLRNEDLSIFFFLVVHLMRVWSFGEMGRCLFVITSLTSIVEYGSRKVLWRRYVFIFEKCGEIWIHCACTPYFLIMGKIWIIHLYCRYSLYSWVRRVSYKNMFLLRFQIFKIVLVCHYFPYIVYIFVLVLVV